MPKVEQQLLIQLLPANHTLLYNTGELVLHQPVVIHPGSQLLALLVPVQDGVSLVFPLPVATVLLLNHPGDANLS